MLFTAQKMKFSIKDFFSKYDEIRRKLRIWPHLLKKSLMENFIFCTVVVSFLFGFKFCCDSELTFLRHNLKTFQKALFRTMIPAHRVVLVLPHIHILFVNQSCKFNHKIIVINILIKLF